MGEFMRLSLYARGEQSVAKYKNELAIDGDLSYLKFRLDTRTYNSKVCRHRSKRNVRQTF